MTVGRLRREVGITELVGWSVYLDEKAKALATTPTPTPPPQWRRGRPRGVDIMAADPARAIAALTGG